MNTYTSILQITPAVASAMKKSEVREVARNEIYAIDSEFKAQGKSAGLGGSAKNALASGVKETAAGCLNLILPFAALGHYKMGKKKTAITQVILCCLALIVPMCIADAFTGVILCYVVGFVYNLLVGLWNKLVSIKNSAKAAINLTNPYIQWKNLTEPEHFTSKEYYTEYITMLNEREAHYLQIIKCCK